MHLTVLPMHKEGVYRKAGARFLSQLHGADQLVPKMATLVAALKEQVPYYSGCGFYFAEEPEMEVGPYQGNVVCAKIGYEGICGKAAKTKKAVIVADAKHYKERIICDEKTQSEMALPVQDPEGRIVAIFYAESHAKASFDQEDELLLLKLFQHLF